MPETLHEYVVRSLNDAKGTWPSISEETGVSRRTMEKIASGFIRDPGVSHIEKLAAYFRERLSA